MRRSQLRKSRATSLQDDPESPALRPALWQPPLPPLPNTRDLAVVVDPLGSEGFRLLALTRATMQEGSVATDDHLDAVITTPPPRYRDVAAEMAPGIDRVLYTAPGRAAAPCSTPLPCHGRRGGIRLGGQSPPHRIRAERGVFAKWSSLAEHFRDAWAFSGSTAAL